MGNALWAGISGLNASSTEMDVISNNIANVNTIGYKAGKIYFADVLSQSLSGGSSGAMQVGRGTQVQDVATDFGPGSFETTGNATDVAIDGDGFFIVNDKNGASYYTRAGAFHLDNNGNLVDTNGDKLQGYNFFGASPGTVSDINLTGVQSAPVTTTTFSVGANLDASTTIGDTYSTTQTVYDTLGEKHSLSVLFRKTQADDMWGLQCSLDGTATAAQTADGLVFDNATGALSGIYTGTLGAPVVTTTGTGAVSARVLDQPGDVSATGTVTLTYNGTSWAVTGTGGYTNATLIGDITGASGLKLDLTGNDGADVSLTLSGTWKSNDTIAIPLTHTATTPIDLSITFAALPTGATIGNSNVVTWDLAGSTALPITDYASTSVTNSLTNDGYASGLLSSLSITSDGKISGFFTNGQTSDVGQIVLANFSDPQGLKKLGSNLFGETVNSGQAIVNVPGASGMGTLQSNSLEMSNTDLATEFVNMITAQKAYSANARVITTEDSMLTELINIKR